MNALHYTNKGRKETRREGKERKEKESKEEGEKNTGQQIFGRIIITFRNLDRF
jgi:hypothetical protein